MKSLLSIILEVEPHHTNSLLFFSLSNRFEKIHVMAIKPKMLLKVSFLVKGSMFCPENLLTRVSFGKERVNNF